MPRYYFFLREKSAPPHIAGAVFRDAAAAEDFARRLRVALTDRAGFSMKHWSVAVSDEKGFAVFEAAGGKSPRQDGH
jgi:hypothetical protein